MSRKLMWLIVGVAVAVAVLASQVFAAPCGRFGGMRAGRMHVRHAMWMARALNLTDAQREQARAIMKDSRERMQQVLTPEQRQQMQQFREQRGMRMHRRGQWMQDQKLTADQQAKITAIVQDAREKAKAIRENEELSREEKITQFRALRQTTHDQIRQILPAEIRDKVPAAPQRGQHRLNLTDKQREQMRTIREDAKAKFRALLTPEQQAKIDAWQKSRINQQPQK